jgi:hypothetical protein
MSTLTASLSPLIVPLGGAGVTTISWDSGSPDIRVKIFERFNQVAPWKQRPLISPPVKGTYPVKLEPGGIYEALMYYEDSEPDPNNPRDESPTLAALTVFALLPGPTNLMTDGFQPGAEDVGGTYYARKIATGVPTFATMEVGRRLPEKDAIGQYHIPDGLVFNSTTIGKVWGPPQTIHDFVAVPLDPGQVHFCVVRVWDASGRWDERQFGFGTKRRNVKLQWDDLIIIDDGVSFGSGSGFFRVELFQSQVPLGDLWWDRITSFNTGDKIDILPLGMITETGLQSIDTDNRDVSVNLWGKSYRSAFVADEIARTEFGARAITIPVGRSQETVVNRRDLFGASAKYGGGITGAFSFGAHVRVNITYAP